MKDRCPELKAAALSGQGLPSLGHARSCPECAAEREAMAAIFALAEELPYEAPAMDRIEEIRGRVIGLAPAPGRRPRLGFAWAAAAILLVTALTAISVSTDPPVPAPVLKAGADAVYVHSISGADDRVALKEGRLELSIPELPQGRMWRLATDDAEIEIRGAVFSVEATSGLLSRIEVVAGLVELRREGRAPIELGPGERWQRPAPVIEAPKAPAPEVEPAVKLAAPESKRSPKLERKLKPVTSVEPVVAAAPIAVPANERAFRDAWAAFARGDLDQAISLFAEAERADPTATLAEDACYGRSVALERAGRGAEAAAEMRRFLERFPTSLRGDEVAVALGWLVIESDPVSARVAFERGQKSAVDRVRVSAERGLEALGRR